MFGSQYQSFNEWVRTDFNVESKKKEIESPKSRRAKFEEGEKVVRRGNNFNS